jgi:DNA-binding CsgD family transcriptional regulator
MSQYFAFGLPAVLAGMCAISYVYFGFYLLPTALKDRRFRPLVYVCALSSIWSFCYVMYFLSSDAEMKGLWQRFTFSGLLALAFILWFWIRYTGFIRDKRIVTALSCAILLPPLIGAYKSVADNAVIRDFPNSFWFLYMEIQSTLYNLVSIILLMVFHLRQKTRKSRMQALILCTSGFILSLFSWIADYYFGFMSTNNINPFWLLIWMGILLYTIKKYRLITITPDFISRDITENIEEGIILLDRDFKVIFRNRSVLSLLDGGPETQAGWMDTVVEKQALMDELSGLMKPESDSFRARVNVLQNTTGGKKISVDLKVKKVVDAFKDVSGYLIIVSMVKDIHHLKTLHGITARELDVIRQQATGKSNREIARFLNVTERTVETHVTSIYAKLGVGNRIELLNALADYESFRNNQPNSAEPITQ